MGPVSASIVIDVPRERVFELLVDLSLRPAFYGPLASELRMTRDVPRGVGAGARFKLEPLGEYVDTEIRSLEPPHTIRESGRGGTLNRVVNHTVWRLVEGPAPETTELTMSFWIEPTSIVDRARYATRRTGPLRRAMARALRTLRDAVEEGGAIERLAIAGRPRLPH